MNTYKVVCSQLIWYETFVQAESEDEAEDIVKDDAGDLHFAECGHGTFDIEDVQEVSHD